LRPGTVQDNGHQPQVSQKCQRRSKWLELLFNDRPTHLDDSKVHAVRPAELVKIITCLAAGTQLAEYLPDHGADFTRH
jgi:hypothetical protein